MIKIEGERYAWTNNVVEKVKLLAEEIKDFIKNL